MRHCRYVPLVLAALALPLQAPAMLRYLFGLAGATLTTGAVNLAGCTRCDAAAIEPYLAGLV